MCHLHNILSHNIENIDKNNGGWKLYQLNFVARNHGIVGLYAYKMSFGI